MNEVQKNLEKWYIPADVKAKHVFFIWQWLVVIGILSILLVSVENNGARGREGVGGFVNGQNLLSMTKFIVNSSLNGLNFD